jgi:hypothetical protein
MPSFIRSGPPIGGNPDPGSADEREVDRRRAPLERGASEVRKPFFYKRGNL